MRLYLDTSVFSAYYDLRTPERLEMTKAFWKELDKHEKLCSELTLEEIGRASAETSQKMLELAGGFKVLSIDAETKTLAEAYIEQGVVPVRYFADALHIASAVLADADILVSWNFHHMVRRGTRLLVNYVNAMKGLRAIEILAPPEF